MHVHSKLYEVYMYKCFTSIYIFACINIVAGIKYVLHEPK